MNGSVKSMPVGDLFGKIRLLFWGFLLPTLLLMIGILTAPIYLRYSGIWKKAEVLVVEINDQSSAKQWKSIGNLYKKEIFSQLWIILPWEKTLEKRILESSDPLESIKANLLPYAIPEDKIKILKMEESEPHSTYFISKSLIKNLVNNEIKSLLIFCDEYESNRVLSTYRKNLAPIGIEVTVYPAKSEWETGNWFMKEQGVRRISEELFLYVYYKIRGYQ
jgi:hypothetical protein